MNKFKSGQLVLVTPIHDFYESTINFPRDKHALYIEPQPDPLLHIVMIDNKLHSVTEGEIREPRLSGVSGTIQQITNNK